MICFAVLFISVIQQCTGRNLPSSNHKLIDSLTNKINDDTGDIGTRRIIEAKEPGRGNGMTAGLDGVMQPGNYGYNEGYDSYNDGDGTYNPSTQDWTGNRRKWYGGRKQRFGNEFDKFDNDDPMYDGQGEYGQQGYRNPILGQNGNMSPFFNGKQGYLSQVIGRQGFLPPGNTGPMNMNSPYAVGRRPGFIENLLSTAFAPFISVINSLSGNPFGSPGRLNGRY